jgi:rhodanese-related sulfurtransferase
MQFVIQNWYLFLALVVIVYLLLAGPITRSLLGIKTLPVSQAVQLMNHESAVVVDVREPDEFRTGHIPNAINIPLGSLTERIKDIEKYKTTPVLLSCRTSQRSARAATILSKRGFIAAHILAGGITAWQGANLPIKK